MMEMKERAIIRKNVDAFCKEIVESLKQTKLSAITKMKIKIVLATIRRQMYSATYDSLKVMLPYLNQYIAEMKKGQVSWLDALANSKEFKDFIKEMSQKIPVTSDAIVKEASKIFTSASMIAVFYAFRKMIIRTLWEIEQVNPNRERFISGKTFDEIYTILPQGDSFENKSG